MRRCRLVVLIALLVAMPRSMCACQLMACDPNPSPRANSAAIASLSNGPSLSTLSPESGESGTACCRMGPGAASASDEPFDPGSAPSSHHSGCPIAETGADHARAPSLGCHAFAYGAGFALEFGAVWESAFTSASSTMGPLIRPGPCPSRAFGALPLFLAHCAFRF